MQLEEKPSDDNSYEMGQEQVDDVLGYESKGIVRMSTKQVALLCCNGDVFGFPLMECQTKCINIMISFEL